MVERSHQTMKKQVIQGKTYGNWQELFIHTNERRKVMNEKYPSRALNRLAPLQAAPLAKENTRIYELGQEKHSNGIKHCLLYTSPSPRDATLSRMPSSA